MPNINEFLNKPEQVYKAELQKIDGIKPCSKCDEDVNSYYWDAVLIYHVLEMFQRS